MCKSFNISDISIHTSAREVTLRGNHFYTPIGISIHTSAREVTETMMIFMTGVRISIHTSAREVTAAGAAFGFSTKFQSTLPQGK